MTDIEPVVNPETVPEQPAVPVFYVPERALVIAAHADDIEFGISGTVARLTASGTQVTYCIVTDNGSGSNDPAVKRADLVETRRREQTASAEVVGVTDVRFLNHPDGMLQATLEVRRDITRVIRDVRPQLVLLMDPTMVITPDGGYINHPDHRAAAEAALYAVFPSAETRPIFPELLDEGLEPWHVDYVYLYFSPTPTLWVDTTAYIDLKLAALRCHESQIKPDNDLKFVREWDGEAGKNIGALFAEGFRVLKLTNE